MMHCSKSNICSLPHPNALHRLLPQVRQQRPPPHPSLPPSASTLSVVSFIIAPCCLRLCCGFFPIARHNFSLLSPITSHGFQASCKSGTATLYCRPDSAFLCSPCNSKAHAANKPPPATLAYPSARSASRTSLTSPARPMLMRKHGRHEGR